MATERIISKTPRWILFSLLVLFYFTIQIGEIRMFRLQTRSTALHRLTQIRWMTPPTLEYLQKCSFFQRNDAEKGESLRLCRLSQLFHHGMQINPQKDAQSQEFTGLGCVVSKKDAQLQELEGASG
ncbi:hypothetical protein BC351_17425 [Paenibacillus ferrarius]|uniref:Uncharacterized protein n=1 Tax=Paenibacillus ferrarius TaxID=1469647 RepID=A0A1V4HQ31_9BACL|nr:hypothetical protein BC351_17425 [Paenibacillus ferrarius]